MTDSQLAKGPPRPLQTGAVRLSGVARFRAQLCFMLIGFEHEIVLKILLLSYCSEAMLIIILLPGHVPWQALVWLYHYKARG